ncbi:MAG TPA: sulfite exporter TauE/SafE family protein [Pyrinomonadaceae bacterium]|jgi:ABC-type nickel/cobalt efflux system permease component RcnA
MESALPLLAFGFVLGLKHATEADHLVAVTTVVSEHRSVWRAAAVGGLWGLGHTAALFAAGAVLILLRVQIPERVATALELAVALMIVLLGSRILYLVLRRRRDVHVHAHAHDGGRTHTHLHFHDREDSHPAAEPHAASHARHRGLWGWRPFLVGVVHGLAGSAALTLFVLAEVMRGGSKLLGFAYLLVFGAGSVGGMLLMSALIGLPFALTAGRFRNVDTPVQLLAGVASVAFGLYYAWETAGGL